MPCTQRGRELLAALPRIALTALVLGGCLAIAPVASSAADSRANLPLAMREQLAEQFAVARAIKQDAIWQGARRQFHEARELSELRRRARRGDKAAIRGLRARRPGSDEGPIVNEPLPAGWSGLANAPLTAAATNVVPTNVICNNPSGDGLSAGQSEECVAALGNQVVVAWNDGQGFNVVNGDVQGYGWSNDGGATFTDGGVPLHPAAIPAFVWTSDPVMTVNEKTGDFYYCGLANTDATHNAIAIARGRFTAGVFAFDSVFMVRTEPNLTTFLDKQWIACDSLTGNLYVTNTTFGGADTISFYRSTNGGRTWSGPQVMSSTTDAGWVQGSRVAVAPNGDVVVTWYAQDQFTDEDNIRFRRSTNGGVSFGGEVTAVKFNQQFGTGAPGFNRERGVNFPGIAVDRTTGPHRGRIYLAWQESFHFLATLLPPVGATNMNEIENNGTAAGATAFTVGQNLRGSLTMTGGTTLDQDWFVFPMSAGQSMVVYADSVTTSRGWYLRLLAPDGVQRECFGGKPDSTSGVNFAYFSFTAPASGSYYLRLIQVSKRAVGYRIRTATGTPGAERGRDQRDAFVTWSDNGGTTWATPTRVNDDGVGYDLFLPEIAVGGDGSPYVKWFDHRDDLYGTRTNTYLSRSVDGGATWAANQKLSSVQSNFTTAGTNIAPNMGDYGGFTSSGTRLLPTWADGRGTSVDVWSAAIDLTAGIAGPADTLVQAPGTAAFGWTLANHDVVFGGTYGVSLASARNWPMPSPGVVPIGAGASAFYAASVSVPDTAAAGPNTLCLTLTAPGGVEIARQCFQVTVQSALGVGGGPLAGLALAPSRPNPARGSATLGFSLPRAGRVRLDVYDLAGARIRTVLDGDRPAGEGSAHWDGRNDQGHPVAAGAYFVALEFGGARLTRRLVLMH